MKELYEAMAMYLPYGVKMHSMGELTDKCIPKEFTLTGLNIDNVDIWCDDIVKRKEKELKELKNTVKIIDLFRISKKL